MKRHILLFAGLIAGTTCFAKEVSISSYSTDTTITAEEFKNAQTDAGNGGIIKFDAKFYKVYETLHVTKSNLSIIGAGKSSTFITYKGDGLLKAIFKTTLDGFNLQQMHVRGGFWPEYKKVLDVNEGTSVVKGVEAAVHIANGALNAKTVGVKFSKISVGLEYQINKAPDGLEVTDCIFVTGRNMINSHNNGKVDVDYTFLLPMKIDNADFIYEPGHGARGIVMDFGNSDHSDPVDLKWSYIKNSYMDKTTNWQIGFTSSKKLTIENNDLMGGGAGTVRTSFNHCIHFEDGCKDFVIKNNRLFQRKKNDADTVLSNTSHVWTGGNDGVPSVTVVDNTFTGEVTTGSLSGTLDMTVDTNKFNSIYSGKGYVINGWKTGSSMDLVGNNTVNGAPISSADYRINP